ncbi:MAG: hypothetical protein O8C61_02525 [Candidatus Methanoperedens sp.]|nr:hypothetical protein [Candidatus Methanoperedens sp.]
MTEFRGRVLHPVKAESQQKFYLFGFSGRGLVGSSAVHLDSDIAMEADIKKIGLKADEVLSIAFFI